MRRFFWTVGMAAIGLLLGLKGQDTPSDMWWTAFGTMWGASIGWGLGTVFDQERPTKWLVVYWAATLAIAGPFFGLLIGAAVQPYPSITERTMAGGIGALVGAVLGLVVGKIQLKRLRARS